MQLEKFDLWRSVCAGVAVAQSVWGLGYELYDRGSRVRFLAGAGNFSLHHRAHTHSGAHPASFPVDTGALAVG
jgi:hypothetical protein